MKIHQYNKYIFSFLDKEKTLKNKSSRFLNCAFGKGDSDSVIKNNEKISVKIIR